MSNKFVDFFSTAQKTPAKTPTATPAGSPPTEAKPAPVATENVSLLQLCDAKLAKLSKYLTGGDETPETPQIETLVAATPAEQQPIPAKPQETQAADNISLLQLCDAKLAKLTQFFTGNEEPQAAGGTTPPEEDAETTAPTEPEPLIPETHYFPDTNAATPDDTRQEQDKSRNIRAEKAFNDASERTPTPAIEPSYSAPQAESPPDAEIPVAAFNHGGESRVVEQLLALEQRLERYVVEAKSAEAAQAIFQEELQQQIAAAAQSHAQQLLEHKNMLDITLKSGFKKISDGQATLEQHYDAQFERLRQGLAGNEEKIAAAAGALNNLNAQVNLLNERLLQLTQNIATFQASVDIDAVNSRLTALENPPQKKRKSWFKK